MCLSAHKKYPTLEHGIEDSNLTQWLRDNTGLTIKLAKEIVKPFLEWHAEHLHIGTTWNEAAKRSQEKCELHLLATGKNVAPHPEQVTSLLDKVGASMPLNANDNVIVNEPLSSHTGPSAHPDALPSHMIGLSYDNEDLELST